MCRTGAAGVVVLLVLVVFVVVSLVFFAALAVAVGVFGFRGDSGGAGPAVAVRQPSAAPTHRALGGRLRPLCNHACRELSHQPVLSSHSTTTVMNNLLVLQFNLISSNLV